MSNLVMPCLTAANQGPHLGNVVRLLSSVGLDASRVNLTLQRPDLETWQEVYYQQPEAGTPLAGNSSIEVHIDPECGYLVPVKRAWKKRLDDGLLTKEEISRRLWMLGELQILLTDRIALLSALLTQVPSFLHNFFCLTPNMYHTFSDDEMCILLQLLRYKRNSNQPQVLSMLFTRILGITCTFQRAFTDVLPHILMAYLDAESTRIEKAYQAKIRILEYLFVPVTCRVVYMYRHPMAVINHRDTRLNVVQLG